MTTLTATLRAARSRAMEGEWGRLEDGREPLLRRVLDAVRSLDGMLLGDVEATDTVPPELHGPMLHLRLTRACLVYIFLEAHGRSDAGLQVLVTPADEHLAARMRLLFDSLLTNLINTTLAIDQTFAAGLDFPMRSLARSDIELTTALLGLTADEQFRDAYLAWVHELDDAENLKHWRSVRPKDARRAIERFLATSTLESEIQHYILEALEHDYAWLSAFEHGHVVAMIASAHAVSEDPDAPMRLALGRRSYRGVGALAKQLVGHHQLLILLLFHVLNRVHGWSPRQEDPAFRREMVSCLKFHEGLSIELMHKFSAE